MMGADGWLRGWDGGHGVALRGECGVRCQDKVTCFHFPVNTRIDRIIYVSYFYCDMLLPSVKLHELFCIHDKLHLAHGPALTKISCTYSSNMDYIFSCHVVVY